MGCWASRESNCRGTSIVLMTPSKASLPSWLVSVQISTRRKEKKNHVSQLKNDEMRHKLPCIFCYVEVLIMFLELVLINWCWGITFITYSCPLGSDLYSATSAYILKVNVSEHEHNSAKYVSNERISGEFLQITISHNLTIIWWATN